MKQVTLSTLLVLTLVSPVAAIAQGTASSTPRGNFCTRFQGATPRILETLETREERLANAREDRNDRIANYRKEIDGERDRRREKHKKQIDALEKRLGAYASTTPEKAAVKEFVETIRGATIKRQSAVDAAVTGFRADIDTAIENRRTEMVAAVAAFKAAVSKAMSDAKAACASGTNPETVHAQFVSDLKSARMKFEEARKGIERLRETREPLRDKRKAAIKQATDDFRIAVETAHEKLRKVLSE